MKGTCQELEDTLICEKTSGFCQWESTLKIVWLFTNVNITKSLLLDTLQAENNSNGQTNIARNIRLPT